MTPDSTTPGLLFETSWEVCNKVGGIYTVLSSKAKTLKRMYGDRVVFIGPDFAPAAASGDAHAAGVFTPVASLFKDWAADPHLPEGVSVRVGRWEVPGRPIAVLVKFDGMYAHKDALYARMWELYGVDSLHAYGDYDEGCAFAHAAALVMDSLSRHLGAANVVGHFNEWTTAMGLLWLKANRPDVATVFTTHATCIGRSICGNNKPLYDYLAGYNGDQMADELNMQSKHSLEKAAAWQADCFTTVSEVTARECEQLLGRRPDIVTPNGFEADFVPGPRKRKTVRSAAREALLGLARTLTGAALPDDTFIIATSGRCEWRNKGLDVFCDTMRSLNLPDGRTAVAFVLVPGCSPETRAERLGDVWTIFLPKYLDGRDGSLGVSYYDTLPGIDATVFASYYEPWGYTPLESVSFGVPTITTTLAGFGQWVLESSESSFEISGVDVIARTDSNHGETVDHINHALTFLASLGPKEMDAVADAARRTADAASWTRFINFYVEAYTLALAKARARMNNN